MRTPAAACVAESTTRFLPTAVCTRIFSETGAAPTPKVPVTRPVELALIVVAATVLGVVAPTVPLMFILAVPVRFVTVPLAGVPRIAPLPSVATPVTPSVLLNVPVVAATDEGVVAPSVPFSAPPVMVGLVSVLFVSVSVVARPTSISVASGNERILSTVCVLLNIVRVFVVPPAALNMMRLVASVLSCTLT